MSTLWILIIAVLGLLTVFLLLVIVLAVIMVKYGLVYTPPRFILVILNLLTGESREISPGLRPIIPGVYKIIRMVGCLPHVMGVETIDVVSSDGQPCSVTYQQTWWVDAFKEKRGEKKEEEKKEAVFTLKKLKFKDLALQIMDRVKKTSVELKEGRAIKAATCISDEKKENETEEQAFERHASSNVKLETEATITSMIGSYDTDILKTQGEYSIYCPECNEEITKVENRCPAKQKTDCGWGTADINIPKDFKARLGWLTTVLLDKSLSDRFGIGCETKISNIVPPKPLQKALLDQQVAKIKMDIAEKKGEATQRLLAKESLGYGSLKDIGINANVAYIMGKLVDGLSDLLEHLLKSAIPKESHLKGGEVK